MARMHILDGGLQTSLQGRPMAGRRHIALPGAGPADPISHALANWCVGNAPDVAALEITLSGASFRFDSPATIAVCGAADSADIDGRGVDTQRSHRLEAGSVLHIHGARRGVRSYLAVAAGFDAPQLLGGTSSYLPAAIGKPLLRAGMELGFTRGDAGEERHVPDSYRLTMTDEIGLHAVPGPEYDRLDAEGRRALFEDAFTIGNRANRIGCELEGTALRPAPSGIASAAVFPGTVQAPPSGKPFLLGVDAQTTGGYPRIAQVIRADRHSIGQLRPGTRVRFLRTDPERAAEILRRKLLLWRALMPGLRL